MLYRKIVASVLTVVILVGPVAAGPQSPTVFKKVDFYIQEGDKMRDHDAQIIIDPRLRSIKFAQENNASRTFALVEWDRITGVTYENTKHARITAALLVAWPFLFLKGRKHWLTITFGPGPNNTPGGYVYARMDKDNYRNILAAINGFTGREIRRIEEGGKTSTLYPGAVTQAQPVAPTQPPSQVQPVAPTQQRQVQPVAPAQPRIAVGNSTSTAPSRPGDTISAGALPPMPPTWTPPEKLAHSATWTTRDADGVRYQMSATVANHNDVAMRAVAAVVLHEATGGALYTTRVSFVVPPNATHEEKGAGTVPNEAATRGDYWSIDIEWDPASLPTPTSPTPPPEDTGIAPILVPDHLGRVRLVGIHGEEVEATGSPTTSDARAGAVRLGDDGDLIAPVQIHRANPEYPASARRAGIEGLVVIEVVVMADGTVADPRILRGLPDEELNRLALEAVAKWTYEPGYKDGQPAPFIVTSTVVYKLQ